MKRTLFVLSASMLLSLFTYAQGNGQNKNKNSNGNNNAAAKEKKDNKPTVDKDKSDKQKHEKAIWEGTQDAGGGGPKPSKNQPARVRAAFLRDYPNAGSVSWSKYRGDWTATFRNGFYWSTAIYHANGDRRDTRTQIPQSEVPVKILDIFKKKPETKVEDVIKIDEPKKPGLAYRIKTVLEGMTKYQYYNKDGLEIQYNY